MFLKFELIDMIKDYSPLSTHSASVLPVFLFSEGGPSAMCSSSSV
jgi:hypothetical protein